MFSKFRKPPTYAKPRPKRIVFTPEEITDVILLLAACMEGKNLQKSDDEELIDLVERCLLVRSLFKHGHEVTIDVSVGKIKP